MTKHSSPNTTTSHFIFFLIPWLYLCQEISPTFFHRCDCQALIGPDQILAIFQYPPPPHRDHRPRAGHVTPILRFQCLLGSTIPCTYSVHISITRGSRASSRGIRRNHCFYSYSWIANYGKKIEIMTFRRPCCFCYVFSVIKCFNVISVIK